MNKRHFKSIALNWRWVKLLFPFWIIFGGIPLILMGKPDLTTAMTVFAVALIPALAATMFCIRCYIYYIQDFERQKQELDALEKELAPSKNGHPTVSPQTEVPLQQKPINH